MYIPGLLPVVLVPIVGKRSISVKKVLHAKGFGRLIFIFVNRKISRTYGKKEFVPYMP